MDKGSILFRKTCREIIKELKKVKTKNQLNKIKLKIIKKNKLSLTPTNVDLAENASIKERKRFKDLLSIKPTRVLSGVNVVAIMTKPIKCPHGKCSYCPGGPKSIFGNLPQSYTGKEPATRRAIRNKYDPYLQVFNRLEQYIAMNRIPDKVELIIMGGTFPSFRKKYQENFIKYAFKALNDFSRLFFKNNKLNSKKFMDFFELPGDINNKERTKRIIKKCLKLKKHSTLKLEQKKNELAKIRCVGLTIETRPDFGKLKHGNEMLKLGCTRVELGIQTIYDDILKKINRGHSTKDSIESTRTLKDLGFKINYHMMPGLPGVPYKKDLEAFKILFQNENFKPDMLKIYPCMVLKGTKLYNKYKKGGFKPLTTRKAAKLIIALKKFVPSYVRIMRVQRDIPTFMTEAGVDRTNLRQYIEQLMKKNKIKCKCIRCREIGRSLKKPKSKKYKIKTIHYNASKGNEFFIAAELSNHLLGYCRLRFPYKGLRKEITDSSSLIRELHVFGLAEEIGKKGSVQHKGIGKNLLRIAENISKTYFKDKIVIISAIGTRQYYKRLGYKLEGPYMVKSLS